LDTKISRVLLLFNSAEATASPVEFDLIENLVSESPAPAQLPSEAAAPAVRPNVGNMLPPVYLYIPITRFIFMSFISFGLYSAYWIYKNWRYVKERDGLEISPFWRGIFGVFFVHGILEIIRYDTEANRIEPATFSPFALTAGWVLLLFFGYTLESMDTVGLNILGIFLASFSLLIFTPVQIYINRINDKRTPRPSYTKWSLGHILCLLLGAALWVNTTFHLLLPPALGMSRVDVMMLNALHELDVDEVRRSVASGADPNLKIGGRPLTFHGISDGDDFTLRVLVNNGADINATSAYGRTALHEAALHGQPHIALFLVQNGATVNARNPRGETPLFYAEEGLRFGPALSDKHKEVAEILRRYGGTR
jgi:hypothetical protein